MKKTHLIKMVKIIITIVTVIIISIFIASQILYTQKPLTIITPEGSNQPYHPSVVYLSEKFNGFSYWLVQTPYPIGGKPYRDRWEYPCIYASNDGINWIVPKTLNNPIDDLNQLEVENKDFFSDPHLLYNSTQDRLECWYRITHFNKDEGDKTKSLPTYIVRKVSYDGVKWSERELMINLQNINTINNEVGKMVISQSIFWDRFKYRMWYVDELSYVNDRNVCYSESKDGKVWTKKKICLLQGKKIDPWHLDLQYINGKYYVIIYSKNTNELTLWISIDGDNFKFEKILLRPSHPFNSFYKSGLYRSCLVWNGKGYMIYFSANNGKKTSLGLMAGSNLSDMEIVDVK